MSIIVISYLVGELIWNIFLSEKIKVNNKFLKILICIVYYIVVIYGSWLVVYISNKLQFNKEQMTTILLILLILLVYAVIVEIVNSSFFSKFFFQIICIYSIVYYYIVGMQENLNAWILLLVISVIYKLVKCVQRRKNNKINNKE